MPSEIGIINSALIKAGAKRISDTSDTSKGAELAVEQLPKKKQEFLESHPWNFARSRVELAQLSTAPAFGYTYQYQLPTNCIKPLRLFEDVDYRVEGRKLLTDSSTAKIEFIDADTPYGNFPMYAAEALSYILSVDISYGLSSKSSLVDSLIKRAEHWLRHARSMDAQEGTPEDVVADEWLNARL